MRVPLLFASFSFVCSLFFCAAAAAGVYRGAAVVIGRDDVVDGNVSANGRDVAVHGHVRGDVVVSGGDVVVDGVVDGDVLAGGRVVSVGGRVAGDVRVVAGSVVVGGDVGGDLACAGARVLVDGRVGGDLFAAGGSVAVDGSVAGDAYVYGGALDAGGAIGGDVIVEGAAVALGADAVIGGDVSVRDGRGFARAPGARVDGVVEVVAGKPPAPSTTLLGILRVFVGLALLGAAWRLVLGPRVEPVLTVVRTAPATALAAGVGFLVLAPLVLVLVFAVGVFVGGWWLALFGAALYGFVSLSALPCVAAALAHRLRAEREHQAASVLSALLVLTVLLRLPFVGAIVGGVATAVGVGAFVVVAWQQLRPTSRLFSPDAP